MENALLPSGLFTMKTPLGPASLVSRVVHLEVATKYRVVKAFCPQKNLSPNPLYQLGGLHKLQSLDPCGKGTTQK